MTEIKNIVFDIGRVLVNLHLDVIEKFLLEYDATHSNLKDFTRHSGYLEHERGDISRDEFFQRVQTICQRDVDFNTFRQVWQGIFSPNIPMLELAQSLKQQYGVYILSNTNPLHWEVLQQDYQLHELVHGVVTSFEARAMKPEPVIYEHLINRFNLIPAETLFIDDLAENAQGARDCGWLAIHHTSNEDSLRKISALNIRY